jgi:hypothetical protein
MARQTVIPRGLRGRAERSIDYCPGSVFGVGHQVGVDPQREARVGVAQIVGEGPDRHTLHRAGPRHSGGSERNRLIPRVDLGMETLPFEAICKEYQMLLR